jgi:hypothetical protein
MAACGILGAIVNRKHFHRARLKARFLADFARHVLRSDSAMSAQPHRKFLGQQYFAFVENHTPLVRLGRRITAVKNLNRQKSLKSCGFNPRFFKVAVERGL